MPEYILFLAKTLTVVIAIVVVVGFIISMAGKNKTKTKEHIKVKKLNERYKNMAKALQQNILNKSEWKKLQKQLKKEEKDTAEESRRRVYVLNFNGDIRASAVKSLREEITAILLVASPADEVVLRLESPGGVVPNYGLAASQLQRLRQADIRLTIVVDKVAASGGYMMACVANQILAAPLAITGSIGVIAQLPNFHRLLKKHNIEYEQVMAGEYKRTLSVFGENTKKGREKLQEEVDEAHELFKSFIAEHRPQVDLNKVATGEVWYGVQALELKLVDGLLTSDDYLLQKSKNCDVFEVCYKTKKPFMERLTSSASHLRAELSDWFHQENMRHPFN